MASQQFWNTWLFVVSVLLAIQGVSWIVLGSFDPFGIYDGMASRAILGVDSIPDSARPIYRFVLGLLGATDAAFFVLFAFIAKYPFVDRQRWAHVALTTGLLTWFILDCAFSMLVGAWFNIAIVNLPCLALIGVPLLCTARDF